MRAELRFPDPSANPYLAFATILAAALDGVENKLMPPAPLNNINVYHLDESERAKMGISSLPGSLAEALGELEKDKVVRAALGENIFDAFTRAKWDEWDAFRINVTDWEVERYLEIA
jgi:glutamine synthetase